MGTKNNPARYDCYSNADPDEPMFILLARDPLAPVLVELWVTLRDAADPDAAMGAEALDCADAMRAWCAKHRPGKRLAVLKPGNASSGRGAKDG
jgi:hypothetical protein